MLKYDLVKHESIRDNNVDLKINLVTNIQYNKQNKIFLVKAIYNK